MGEDASQTVAGEKPVNTTLLTYVSAGGLAMPPMVIFKGSKVDPDWREAAPSGYVIRASKTGYIQSKLFAEYGEKFIQFLKVKKLDKNGKHLLLLDSHSSHSFNLSTTLHAPDATVGQCAFWRPEEGLSERDSGLQLSLLSKEAVKTGVLQGFGICLHKIHV